MTIFHATAASNFTDWFPHAELWAESAGYSSLLPGPSPSKTAFCVYEAGETATTETIRLDMFDMP
jgi:hypothetical protein